MHPRYMEKIRSAMDLVTQHDIYNKAVTHNNTIKRVNIFDEHSQDQIEIKQV